MPGQHDTGVEQQERTGLAAVLQPAYRHGQRRDQYGT